MRKIVVVTGRRAEYGLSVPMLKAIKAHPDLELHLIVTGMHLSDEVGSTINEINRDGFSIASTIEVDLTANDSFTNLANFSRYITGITDAVKRIQPDIICVLTDLDYALAGAIVGLHSNTPVAHLHGGELSGTIDDSIRHAITKLSHIHLTSTPKSAERILKMGEQKELVFVVGAPGVDNIPELIPKKQIIDRYKLPEDYIILLQHPVTTESHQAETQIMITLEALKQIKIKTIAIKPNLDLGGDKIINLLKKTDIDLYDNIPRREFLSLLSHSKALVGNSSCGIVESATFKVPVVNIGTRQEGRERARNVIDVNHEVAEIIEAVKKAISKGFHEKIKTLKNPYEGKDSGVKIANILSGTDLRDDFIQKKMTY